MPDLYTEFVVAAPAEDVWEVIGRRFDRIGEWATAIPASTALPPAPAPVPAPVPAPAPPRPPLVDAPVAGRVCTTGVRLMPRVTETLVAYDDANRTLTYEGSGMPRFVTTARNTWTVTPVDERHCRVLLRARFDTRGLLGVLGRWAILARVRRTGRHLAHDLGHYVETGTPSPRKQRQLTRARSRVTAALDRR